MADNEYYSTNFNEAMDIARMETEKCVLILTSDELQKLITLVDMAMPRLEAEDVEDAERIAGKLRDSFK